MERSGAAPEVLATFTAVLAAASTPAVTLMTARPSFCRPRNRRLPAASKVRRSQEPLGERADSTWDKWDGVSGQGGRGGQHRRSRRRMAAATRRRRRRAAPAYCMKD